MLSIIRLLHLLVGNDVARIISSYTPCSFVSKRPKVPKAFSEGLVFVEGTLHFIGGTQIMNAFTRKVSTLAVAEFGGMTLWHSGWLSFDPFGKNKERPVHYDWEGCYMPDLSKLEKPRRLQRQQFEKNLTLYRMGYSGLKVSRDGKRWTNFRLQGQESMPVFNNLDELLNSWCLIDHYVVCVIKVQHEWVLRLFDVRNVNENDGKEVPIAESFVLPSRDKALFAYVLADCICVHVRIGSEYWQVSCLEAGFNKAKREHHVSKKRKRSN